MYCYEGQKQLRGLLIPIQMFDNEYFMNWFGTTESKIWHKMFRHVIRGRMESALARKILKEYYEERNIVAMYKSQEEIAKFLGLRSKSSVSMALANMIEKGIIIPHKDVWLNRRITIYEVATHSGEPHRHETIHLYTYFTKLKADKELGL